jgi:hypothetical protein
VIVDGQRSVGVRQRPSLDARTMHGPRCLPDARSVSAWLRCGEDFLYVFKGARSAPGAWRRGPSWARCPRSGIECELSDPACGRARFARGDSGHCRSARSALGRRRPRRAAGTRDPGHRPHQVAAITPTVRGPHMTPRHTPALQREAAKVSLPVASKSLPIPGASHCLSRPEPVKGA